MATVVKSFVIQGIDGYSVDIETRMLEGQCLWQGKAYFAATMSRIFILLKICESIISERYMLAIRNDGRKVSCVNQWKS